MNRKAEFNKEQFQEMMRGELWRFSRKELTNVLSLSDSRDFAGTILMLKLFENQFIHEMKQLTRKVDHQQGANQESCAYSRSWQLMLRQSKNPCFKGRCQQTENPLRVPAQISIGKKGNHTNFTELRPRRVRSQTARTTPMRLRKTHQ